MSMYLAIHEAPCVGVAPVAFDADTDAQAEDIAFDQSRDCREFVTGGYDLYRIVWNPRTHVHELTPVTPESACTEDVAPEDYEIMPCDLDPFGECPKPEYARDCAKCRGWTESEADKACHDSLADS